MKKFIALSVTILSCLFILNSCDPWEDDTFIDGGGGGGGVLPEDIMLLKEKHTSSFGGDGLETYSYDNQNRLILLKSVLNINDLDTYNEVSYVYHSNEKVDAVTKSYFNGQLQSTMNISMEILDSSTAYAVIKVNGEEFMTIDYEFSAPCGLSKEIMTMAQGEVMTSTYEYSGSNCNSVQYTDGEWVETITNDNKNPAYYEPFSVMYGIIKHNPIKIESEGDPDETITYEYNEKNYPTSAVHSFDGLPENFNIEVEYIYY